MTDFVNNGKTILPHPRAKLATAIVSLCFALLFWSPVRLVAQGKPKASADKALMQLLENVRQADGYAYTTRVQSTVVGDTQKSPVQTTFSYGSRSAFVMYAKSETELVFLCSKGQFKVDETHKEVYYKLFQNDAELNEVKQLYLDQVAGSFDSVFLTGAVVKRKKLTKARAEYELVYPATAAMKSFKMQVKLPGGTPERMEYAIERPLNQHTHPMMIIQKMTMDQYSTQMPREVTQLLAASEDLQGYLERKYASYALRKI